jgi:drug/metabolite transporter (DMT)-like permease
LTALSAVFVACWSSGFIGAKLGASQAPVATVLMWRFVPLVLVLVPVAYGIHRASAEPRPGGRVLCRHVVIGMLSQAGYLATVYWAIGQGVNTGTTALIDGIQPIAAAALVGPLLGIVVTRRQWVGLGLGMAGVSLVTWSDAAHAAGVRWWVYLIPLLGMLSLIAATAVARSRADSLPPITSLTIQCCASALLFTVAALLTGTAVPPLDVRFWTAMAWLIGSATFGGYGLYWLLIGRLGITRVNALMFLMAPVTASWGVFMFGESFTGSTAAGLVIGLVAVLIVNSGAAGRPEPSCPEPSCPEPSCPEPELPRT